MRVLSCLAFDHNPWMVLLAACMCAIGSAVIVHLYRRAVATSGSPRFGWLFLTAVCSGSSIWATHFLAMLGYKTDAVVYFEPVLTFASILIAIVGTGLGFALASASKSKATLILGGGMLGLSIAAMHYTGMFAYRVQGIVGWHTGYVAASIALAVGFSIAAIDAERRWRAGRARHLPIMFLLVAIVSLHFTGMAAFQVTPTAVDFAGLNAQAMQAMGIAVLVAALIIVGTGVSSYLIDERTRAAGTEQLRRLAFQDPLTGLANRRSFQEHLRQAHQGDSSVALLLIDLDHFKAINDTYGHTIGDRLLTEVGRRLTELRDFGTFAARVGGDELAIVARVPKDKAIRFADRVVDIVDFPIELSDRQISCGCSIGICMGEDATSAEEMMKHADLALYAAKRHGRRQASMYRAGMAEAAARKLRMEADLEVALAQDQFHLVYQPLVDLSTGSVIGYEALLRWHHPERGAVPPDEFVPLAEETGAILDIGRWVVEEACRQAASWDDHLHVAVNASAVQLRTAAFLSHVTHALSASGLAPHRLEIELTETAMVMNGPQVAHMLDALRTLGTRISMDDFGTGYSSLAHLRDLPLDRIKIDRSFVSQADTDGNCMAVLRAITQLGRDMRIPTLAEGVETADQEQMLRALGCNAVQGFLFGKPERWEVHEQRNAEALLRPAMGF